MEDAPHSPELFLFLAVDRARHEELDQRAVRYAGEVARRRHARDRESVCQMGQMLYQTRRLNDNLMQLLALYKQVGKPGYPFDAQPLEVGQVVEQVVALSRVLLDSRASVSNSMSTPT